MPSEVETSANAADTATRSGASTPTYPYKKGVDVRPMLQNFITSDDPLNLDNIRSTLIRLEDTIIFGASNTDIVSTMLLMMDSLVDVLSLLSRGLFSVAMSVLDGRV